MFTILLGCVLFFMMYITLGMSSGERGIDHDAAKEVRKRLYEKYKKKELAKKFDT